MRLSLAKTIVGIFSLFALFIIPAFGQGALTPIRIDPTASQNPRTVHLELIINGRTTQQFMECVYTPTTKQLTAKRSEFEEAGVRAPGAGQPEEIVAFEAVGAAWQLDERSQKIYMTLSDEQRLPKDYDSAQRPPRLRPTVDPGFLVNYSIFRGSFKEAGSSKIQSLGGNVSVDARAFSKFGVLSQTAIVGSTLYKNGNGALRLDTTYSYSDVDSAVTGRAGDIVSGGLNWTRPVRMGGAQLQRDFALRSNIVTAPIPTINGTAAVPSTVDVFVNGLRTISQDVGSGPFRLSNVPLLSGSGEARVVVRDATGRETETFVPLTNPAQLLRPGLYDYSVDAGFARMDYATASDNYDRRPIASATLRRGIYQSLTLEAHAEGGAGLTNAGIGAVTSLGALGVLSFAGSASHAARGVGAQFYASWEGSFKSLTMSFASQRTIGRFSDLASVTARLAPSSQQTLIPSGPILLTSSALSSLNPPTALDRVSFSAPLGFDAGMMSLSLIHSVTDTGVNSKVAALSYSRPLPKSANLFVTAFADFGSTKSKGIFAGVSMPISDGVFASASGNLDSTNRVSGSLEVSRAQQMQDNTYGWRARDSEGKSVSRQAEASYRSPYGQIGGQLHQYGQQYQGNVTYDGSIAVMGGGVFAGNKVTSSFAVVDAGQAGVPILQDNRPVGTSNMFGKKLVTDLRAYDANTISIDTSKLPATYDVTATNVRVSPQAKSGVAINFAKQASQASALVIFYGPNGKHIKAGASGVANNSNETFVVGYDGQAYVKNLSAANSVTIETESGQCRAQFPYMPSPGQQVVVDRVTCH